MNVDKEYGGDLCKNHSARSEKDFCRVSPSNLNKKELENVYFTLLQNNLDLKTTINSQCEKIKFLSTKVQRLTALQKTYLGKESKECCGSKAIINEQKECISELKRSNQCLSDRVRQLNMRLCSAKQFLKRSPFQSTSRCNRCINKNVSMSALVLKRSETNLRTKTSSQYLAKDMVSSRTIDNVIISHDKGVQYDFCDENKCRSHIEELKTKNDNIPQELTNMKETHAAVTSQLEREMSDLQAENVRVRSERALATDRAQQLETQLADVTRKLASAGLHCDELSVELAVEKRKVLELETQLKAADMSSRIANAIETHLTNIKMIKELTNKCGDVVAGIHEMPILDNSNKCLVVARPPYKPTAAVRTKIPHSVPVDDVFKNSDDSGYTEVIKSQDVDNTKPSTYINQVLLEKIADLQNQINYMKAFKNNNNKPDNVSYNVVQGVNVEKAEIKTSLPENQYNDNDENIESESSDSEITEKKSVKTIITIEKPNYMEHGNNDSNDQYNKVDKPTEIRHDFEDNKIEKHIDLCVKTNLRESFKRFRRRSKYLSGEVHKLTEGRKLSLENPRELFKERNIIKTGSLDENGIANEDSTKIIKIRNVFTKGFKKNQVNRSNKHIVNNSKENDFSENSIEHNGLKENTNENYKETELVVNGNTTNNNGAQDEKKKDSDSSKGTYSIHKDENASKLKTKTNDEDKDYLIQKEHKKIFYSSTHKVPYTFAADVKKVLDNATSKDKLYQGRSSSSSAARTYIKIPRNISPDSTECEISSMSDLPSERDVRHNYVSDRSPGEERPTTTSDSRADTTTDYGSLSEGELPFLHDSAILSEGEKRLGDRIGKSQSVPDSSTRQIEETLAAVEQEMTRCTRWLRRTQSGFTTKSFNVL